MSKTIFYFNNNSLQGLQYWKYNLKHYLNFSNNVFFEDFKDNTDLIESIGLNKEDLNIISDENEIKHFHNIVVFTNNFNIPCFNHQLICLFINPFESEIDLQKIASSYKISLFSDILFNEFKIPFKGEIFFTDRLLPSIHNNIRRRKLLIITQNKWTHEATLFRYLQNANHSDDVFLLNLKNDNFIEEFNCTIENNIFDFVISSEVHAPLIFNIIDYCRRTGAQLLNFSNNLDYSFLRSFYNFYYDQIEVLNNASFFKKGTLKFRLCKLLDIINAKPTIDKIPNIQPKNQHSLDIILNQIETNEESFNLPERLFIEFRKRLNFIKNCNYTIEAKDVYANPFKFFENIYDRNFHFYILFLEDCKKSGLQENIKEHYLRDFVSKIYESEKSKRLVFIVSHIITNYPEAYINIYQDIINNSFNNKKNIRLFIITFFAFIQNRSYLKFKSISLDSILNDKIEDSFRCFVNLYNKQLHDSDLSTLKISRGIIGYYGMELLSHNYFISQNKAKFLFSHLTNEIKSKKSTNNSVILKHLLTIIIKDSPDYSENEIINSEFLNLLIRNNDYFYTFLLISILKKKYIVSDFLLHQSNNIPTNLTSKKFRIFVLSFIGLKNISEFPTSELVSIDINSILQSDESPIEIILLSKILFQFSLKVKDTQKIDQYIIKTNHPLKHFLPILSNTKNTIKIQDKDFNKFCSSLYSSICQFINE